MSSCSAFLVSGQVDGFNPLHTTRSIVLTKQGRSMSNFGTIAIQGIQASELPS